MTKKRILVLGGGFAGVDCTKKLEDYFHSNYDIEITLVSDDNFLLFTPMLPQIVAGTITPRHIVMPLRALCKKARIYESVVRDIDPIQQHVTLEGTPEKIGTRIHYDYLVIALGSKTNFFGLKNVERNSFTMKTLADAISLRNRIIDMLEQAENEKNSKIKQRLLTFVIVGGGFAGVETAGEINDFLSEAISYYHNIKHDDVQVILVEAVSTILQGFNENLSEHAHNELEKNGIKILLQTAVTNFDGKNVTIKKLSNTSSNVKHEEVIIDSHTLVWTAGVTPVEIIQNSVFKLKNGKIIVNKFLEIPNHPLIIANKIISEQLKTVLIYFHMDGQPVDPSKWNQENPYIPVLKENIEGNWNKIDINRIYNNPNREWRIFGRSTSDDKGPPMMLINALKIINRLM